MVKGMGQGYRRELEVHGVGYRVRVEKDAATWAATVVLKVGYSHEVSVPVWDDVTVTASTSTTIVVFGRDKRRVGLMAAAIQRVQKPNVRVHHVDQCTCTPCRSMYMYTMWTNVHVHHVDQCACTPCGPMYMYTMWTNVHVHHVDQCTCTPCRRVQ